MRPGVLLLLAMLLAGCSSPEPPKQLHLADAVIASADFPPPADRARIEQVAPALGWHDMRADPLPEGFSLNFLTSDSQVVVVQYHPQRGGNWSITRFYNLTDRATRYDTREEASAAATAAWPTFEPGFEEFVSAFERAGGWHRTRIRHACLCAET